MRIAIAFVFWNKFKCCQDSSEHPWKGHDGIMTKIKKSLGLHPKHDIEYILNDVLKSKQYKKFYEGSMVVTKKQDAKDIISTESQEAQIIADSIENGDSLCVAWNLANSFRKNENLPSVTQSSVYGCIKRINPVVEKIGSRKQGSSNECSKCSRVRLLWYLQLEVR